MALYFRDRVPDARHGQNARFYDAVDNIGGVKLSDFKLIMKNPVPAEKQGDPVNAANLNFTSGCAALPVGVGQTIKRGDVVTLTGSGEVTPPYTVRDVALAAKDMNVLAFRHITGNVFMLHTHASSPGYKLCAGVVDFASKTIKLGTSMSNANTSTRYMRLNSFELLNANLLCYMTYNGTDGDYIEYITISGAGEGTTFARSTSKLVGWMNTSRPVRCGESRVLTASTAASGTSSGVITLHSLSGGTVTAVATASVSGITKYTQIKSLVSYDGGKSKYILFYANTDNTETYAQPVNVTGETITIGAVQTITGNLCDTDFVNGGTSVLAQGNGSWQNKLLLTSPAQATSNRVVPGQIQVATVNAGGVLTYGGKATLNVGTGISNAGGTVTPIRLLYAALRSDGSAYLTGIHPDHAKTRIPNMLIEVEVNGREIAVKTNFPFAYPSTSDVNNPSQASAIENPARKGEYMFIETSHYASYNPNLYFGFGSDVPIPNNIAGIALDAPSGNYVPVQLTSKLLSGIKSGLSSGLWYSAGSNGALVQHDGTRQPVVLAVGGDSILFTGSARVV
jgi:hypothetical protein